MILFNSIPKSGTNYFLKASFFEKMRIVRPSLVSRPDLHWQPLNSVTEIGFEHKTLYPEFFVKSVFRINKFLFRNGLTTSHTGFNESLKKILDELEIPLMLTYRHPLETLISRASYIAKTKSHFLYDLYKSRSLEKNIEFGFRGEEFNGLKMEPWINAYKSYVKWYNCDPESKNSIFVYPTYEQILNHDVEPRVINGPEILENIDWKSLWGGSKTYNNPISTRNLMEEILCRKPEWYSEYESFHTEIINKLNV